MDTNELVQRLLWPASDTDAHDTAKEAADALEAQAARIAELEAKVARLREALQAVQTAACQKDNDTSSADCFDIAGDALKDTQP
jgi:hypothetical protein